MKKLIVIMLTLLAGFRGYSQDITGQWNGLLKISGIELTLVFHITKTDTGYSATMDSPDQNAYDIPVSSVSFDNGIFRIEASALGMEYEGTFKNDSIEGRFMQRGMTLPLTLTRTPVEKAIVNHPQEPKPPYPYIAEEVHFLNTKDKITLAGTLTLPDTTGTYPAVVLISGSGAQDRNEEIVGQKPFLVLSDYLTRHGIAVLRYDDRGFGESEGDFNTATSADLANDVRAAVDYLKTRKEIDAGKIGLIGHSEGGLIAPMVASTSDDIDFIVLLAGPGVSGKQILLLQEELIGRASGKSEGDIETTKKINGDIFDIILKYNDVDQIKTEITNYIRQYIRDNPGKIPIPEGMSEDDVIKQLISQVTSPWMLYFIRYDPAPALEKVKCPVLALNGEKDLQVPADVNLRAIQQALEKGGNKNVTVMKLPGLNHLFQECKTGLPDEYATIEQTMSPVVLETVSSWITKQTK